MTDMQVVAAFLLLGIVGVWTVLIWVSRREGPHARHTVTQEVDAE